MLLLPLIFYISKRFRVKAALCGEIKQSTSLLLVRKETSANEVFRFVFALCFPLFDPEVLSKNQFLRHVEVFFHHPEVNLWLRSECTFLRRTPPRR